jgi:predicted ArsR family transcriptional regulator
MPLDDVPPRTPPPPELRQITDAQVLRALTHPVRIALIEALSIEGPMTATQAGERIGESPTTCSFHLRQLAKYDFVEEAGGGKGRARPWRMTSIGMSFSSDHDDPATAMASSALSRMLRERQLGRYQRWRDTQASFPAQWRDAAGDAEVVFYLTAAELKDLNEELIQLLRSRFPERLTDPAARPEGSIPVELLLFSYPMDLPGPPAG